MNELETQLEYERNRREQMELKLDEYKLDKAYLKSQLEKCSPSVRSFTVTAFRWWIWRYIIHVTQIFEQVLRHESKGEFHRFRPLMGDSTLRLE